VEVLVGKVRRLILTDRKLLFCCRTDRTEAKQGNVVSQGGFLERVSGAGWGGLTAFRQLSAANQG
jgi:hypothetical protein